MVKSFLRIVARDVRLALREGNSSGIAVGFFLLVVTLFPLAVGPELSTLSRIAAGVVWVAALLSSLLSLDRMFHVDYEDGGLDLFVIDHTPMEIVALAKATAHWLVTGLPLVLASPILAIMLNMDGEGLGMMVAAMLIGTPALSLLGAVGAGLSVAMKRGGVLVAIMTLPLCVPTLIFGVSAVDAALHAGTPIPNLMILGAISLLALAISPFATAAALKLAVE